ncbi:MAG TPA: hypothetical protein VK142_00840 [Bacillota bacterium]|nr:hypothetical protein [Bacillota bacterium]
MKLLAEQPYIKVQRQVDGLIQKNVEMKRTLYLYDEKVVSKHREFPIQDVTDVSYRNLGTEGGMLYVHTNKGVYSYIVKSSPKNFVDTFKDEIKYKRI